MNSDKSSPVQPAQSVASHRVSFSPYVNEHFPNWEELLSAHDVARLTRRPRWVVLSLALLGRFPRKHRYRGRSIGWLRSDVVHWLANDLRAANCCNEPALTGSIFGSRQTSLPLVCTGACTPRRYRGRRRVLRKGLRHD
jgi:predicted DNA-binding transcriptional regulator AlpA